jgi:hypothetical protein
MAFMFHFIYGMSSFPLTFIFFKVVKTTNQLQFVCLVNIFGKHIWYVFSNITIYIHIYYIYLSEFGKHIIWKRTMYLYQPLGIFGNWTESSQPAPATNSYQAIGHEQPYRTLCTHICRFVEHCTTTCAAIFVVHVYVSTVSMIPNVRRVSNWGYDYYRVCPEIIAQSQGAQNSYRPEKWTKT